MTDSTEKLHFTSAGFWLPCYQSGFFSRTDEEAILRRDYQFTEATRGPFSASDLKLDINIFSRLLMVLPQKGYTSAYPIFASNGPFHEGLPLPDPTATLFLAADPSRLVGLEGTSAHALSLVVTHDGFYIWTVAYTHTRTSEHTERVTERNMRKQLKAHIFHLVGGDFGAHISGRPDEKRPEDQMPLETLQHYREQHIGMLTFFQINTILEGLYNANLDPRVFFLSAGVVHKEYTLGGFIDQITATFHPAKKPPSRRRTPTTHSEASDQTSTQKQEAEATQTIELFFQHYLNDPSGPGDRKSLHAFADLCAHPTARAHILDEFLTVTEVITLKRIKQRIERCRRALLEELIEVTHRRDPLVQAEPPDGPVDRIDDVTEAQLRGYVMLVAAKMPLIANVLFHLKDLHNEHETHKSHAPHRKQDVDANADPDPESEADPLLVASKVYGPYQSWRGLLRALQSDLQSLMDAITQARTDRMLYEQEQIHAEQETLAEIQRLTDRADNEINPAHGIAISVISNILALLAVVLAANPLIRNGRITVNLGALLSLLNADNLPGDLALIVAICVLIAIYFVLHFIFQHVFRWGYRLVKRETRLDSKYYYEIDVRVDAPFQFPVIEQLFASGTPGPFKMPQREGFQQLLPGKLTMLNRGYRQQVRALPYLHPKRNSYRVERLEKSEALHKVYVEADIKVSERRYLHAILVYELLFHRPSKEHDYIFKDLRVVSAHSAQLTTQEVITLKDIIARCFVNPCLDKGWQLKLPDPNEVSDNYDSLFTVTRLPSAQRALAL